jgi:hypothetical protein
MYAKATGIEKMLSPVSAVFLSAFRRKTYLEISSESTKVRDLLFENSPILGTDLRSKSPDPKMNFEHRHFICRLQTLSHPEKGRGIDSPGPESQFAQIP